MSVIEKQYNITQFAGLTSQYNVIVQNAKDDGIDTTAVTTAYNSLNQFMVSVLADPDHASDVDRVAYKKYQDTYNQELANLQNALPNNANNKFTSAASATSQAASTASQAFSAAGSASSQAQSIGNQVDSEMATQSTATANAQSTADSAFSQATTAIDTGNVASQAVTDLKDGSTMTIAQLQNGLGDKVSNSEYASYKYQTASQIGQMVTNGAFSAYQQTTADLISEKVATSDFSSYKDQTATAIGSKVESSTFESYKKQTDEALEDTVSSADYKSDKKETADLISSKVSKKDANNVNLIPYSAMPKANNLQWIEIGESGTLSATTHGLYHNGADSLYELNTAGSNEVFAISPRFKIKANTTYTFQLKGFAGANVSSMDVFVLGRPNGNTSDYTVAQQIITAAVLSYSTLDYRTVTFTTGAIDEAYLRIDNNGSTDGKISILGFTELKLEPGDTATPYVYGAEDSMIAQMSDDINLRVTKDGLISQINLQAGNTLISSSGQLTLSGKNIYFDSANPVIIPSANIDTALINKKLTAADISANTFTTNNGTFTVKQDGSVTANNMTLIDGTLTTPTINGSTINGATLNMQTDGLINSPYNGITQTADQFYHPWKLNTGQLTIGQGYITSVSSGTRSINGVPKQFDSVQGTLSASYLKFTNNYGNRIYIDADMITSTSSTNSGTMVAINATGNIGINTGTSAAPALTIGSGYIDASSSSSYGVFGAITLGYHAHTINSDESLFFESGHGSGNPGINIWAKGFQSLSSRLSTKHQLRLLDDEHSNSLLLGADTATFKYNQDTNADNPNEGVIIDDVNTVKQYNLPDELITRDGKAPTDLMSFIARIISQNKYQARLIENLQIRLRKVEINNE
ncbi:hypothetical protein [Lactiplantibacillus plantarum]|uniref:hypothetical protein n=1 Tax=Lactiplantibacillus plantarum TaxID=1590 RepID=UPI00114D1625|nr:hypothetical protein [Lactiplantibacillus plantarum]WBB05097.1 hypothetical protein O4Z47_05825 [Lactiplantibacillus plantarum]